jgi:hypothetical protein
MALSKANIASRVAIAEQIRRCRVCAFCLRNVMFEVSRVVSSARVCSSNSQAGSARLERVLTSYEIRRSFCGLFAGSPTCATNFTTVVCRTAATTALLAHRSMPCLARGRAVRAPREQIDLSGSFFFGSQLWQLACAPNFAHPLNACCAKLLILRVGVREGVAEVHYAA